MRTASHRSSGGVPTTVVAGSQGNTGNAVGGPNGTTPKTGNGRKHHPNRKGRGGGGAKRASSPSDVVMDEHHEVDAFDNPTELFQWINYGNYSGAAKRVLEYPVEARTWIFSRGDSKKKGSRIKWRYLPLHVVCLQSKPPEQLLRALVFSYPKGATLRDYAGNLPIHYLLNEGCDDTYMIQLLLEVAPDCMNKRDAQNRSLLEIVSEGYRVGKYTRDGMVNVLAVLRQWSMDKEGKGYAPKGSFDLSWMDEQRGDMGGNTDPRRRTLSDHRETLGVSGGPTPSL